MVAYLTASLLNPSQCYLGEDPLWHTERQSCFWVDIENKKIYEYKPEFSLSGY